MKTCVICEALFTPQYNTAQRTCNNFQCAIEHGQQKQRDKARKKFKKTTRIMKAKIKKRSEWIKEDQAAFNAYVRKRDEGHVCISCGKSKAELKIDNPISMVCGHYLSVGSHPELRFHPFNGNLQCTRCNGGAGKYGQFNSKALTVTQEYRVNLIDKIGLENVEWLEGPHITQNRTLDDLKDMKQYYKEQLKLLVAA